MFSELMFRVGDETVQKKPTDASDAEGNEQRYKQ